MSSSQIRTLDLFCGAGGSSYGARSAGAAIVAGIDNWEPAIRTFEANFPEAKAIQRDIRRLSPSVVKSAIGDIDLILASPECIHHSRAKGNGKRSEASKRTVFHVTRFAKVFQPEWIVIENVVEMREWTGYQELLEKLKSELKYNVVETILNAKDFGVSQSRRRLFLLCSKSREPLPPAFLEQFPAADNIIDKSGKYRFSLVEKPGRAEKTLSATRRALDTLGEQSPFLLVYYGSGRTENGTGSGGWQRVTEPLRTVTTLDRFAYVEPDANGRKMRMLQPEELKLAMGYQREFKLDEVERLTRRNRIKLMGNGVCPPVMEAIFQSLTG